MIIIADPSVLGFERMIKRFEVTATGTNISGTWDIDREHCSPTALSFSIQGCIHARSR